MTPMKKLKPQFDEFKILIGNAFNEVVLNKSEYKEEYIGASDEKVQYINKGVKSDCIRLYQLKLNKEDTTTIAFSFDYINKEEKEHRVNFSFSLGTEKKKFSQKIEMTVEQCRDKLNNINHKLKMIENCSNKEVILVVKEEFMSYEYNVEKESKKKKIR